MNNKILVLGGTGLLGQPVVHSLLAAGFQVRLLVRNKEKAQAIFGSQLELLPGDVADRFSLEKALAGCTGVHISVGGDVDQLSAENVGALAAKLGLTRITYISGATVCEENGWFPIIAAKLKAEQAVKESGIPYTIFRPTWPMEMLARFAMNGKPSLIGKQPIPLHFYAAADLGRLVAAAYGKEAAANRILYVHGPEAMPLRTALERYCAVFHPNGAPVKILPVGLARVLGMLTRNKMLQFAAGLMGYFDKVGELGDPTETNQILGAPAITLDEWLQQRKAAES